MSDYDFTYGGEYLDSVETDQANVVLEEVRKYYALPNNICGGSLHIVTDDGNVETEDVIFCLGCAREKGDFVGERIANLLLALSKAERQFIYESDKSIYCK